MDIKTYMEKKTELEAFVEKNGKNILSSFFSEFFADNPDIHAVKWRQYTPYFMDGDACVFSVNDPCFLSRPLTDLNKDLWSWDENPEDENGVEVDHGWNEEGSDPQRKFADELSGLEDLCLNVFGDHAEIFATRSEASVNFEVTDCEHD
mgnify:CR=1 FL=1